MNKFDVLKTILLVFELLAALTGLLLLNKWRRTFWVYFPFYLLFISLSEITATYFARHIGHWANNNLHSFVIRPVTFLFFYWLFYKQDQADKRQNPVNTLVAVVYIAGLLADYFYFRHETLWIHSFSFSLGTVLLLVLLVRYFAYFIFNNILNYRRSMMFWVSLALFIYYVITFPFFALRNTLAKEYPEIFINYWYVQMCLSCLMYILFTFSFIWTRPRS